MISLPISFASKSVNPLLQMPMMLAAQVEMCPNEAMRNIKPGLNDSAAALTHLCGIAPCLKKALKLIKGQRAPTGLPASVPLLSHSSQACVQIKKD